MTDVELTRAEIEVFLEDLTHRGQPGVKTITQLLAQLDTANAKLALHESENVTRGLLIDRLQARADAAAEQMRERCIASMDPIRFLSAWFGGERLAKDYEYLGANFMGDAIAAADRFKAVIAALPLHEEPKLWQVIARNLQAAEIAVCEGETRHEKECDMTPREAIEQAKDCLINNRGLNAYLNTHGTVRIPVIPEICDIGPPDELPSHKVSLYVTFTLEDGYFGKRLMADFQGHKEFAA